MRASPVMLLAAGALFALPSAAGAACSWKLASSLSPGTINILNGVAGSSASDVWAVGKTKQPSSPATTLIEHWGPTGWTIVPSPNPNPLGNVLTGVAVLSPTNAWAVGFGFSSSGGNQALILHWDGKTWSDVAAPPLAGRLTYLSRVSIVSAKDIWAAGGSSDFSSSSQAPLAEHWNGKAWSIETTPNLGTNGSEFAAISATATNDVWAAGGTATNPSLSSYVTFTEHWDGRKWSIVPSPNANAGDNLFNAMVAIAPNDAWAMGDYYTGTTFATLTEHWNGSKWSIIKSPSPGLGDALLGATAFSSTAVWTVGEVFANASGTNTTTLSLKWNGKKWAAVKSPNLPGGNPDYFTDAGAIAGTTTLWAVGASNNPSTGKPAQTLTASDACAELDFAPLADYVQGAPWQQLQPRTSLRPLP